jgi:hypothetical protein
VFRSVFLAEVLAKGEVPRGPRDIWKQRSRWASAAHMYILTPDSVFWYKQRHMSFWQKSLYWIPMILHFTLIWAEPVMFMMPILCLVGNICPYGVDTALWTTHFFKLITTFLVSSYADWSLELSAAAIYGQTMARVLFWVNVKAVLNTVMVYTGWKRPGAFKVTNKGGAAQNPQAKVAAQEVVAPVPEVVEVERNSGGPQVPVCLQPLGSLASSACAALQGCMRSCKILACTISCGLRRNASLGGFLWLGMCTSVAIHVHRV